MMHHGVYAQEIIRAIVAGWRLADWSILELAALV